VADWNRPPGAEHSEDGQDAPAAAPALAAVPAAKIRSMTRMFATASSGGVGVGSPSRIAAAKRSA
jgi:hypothetical protein